MVAWLSDEEQRAWRGLQLMQLRLTATLARELADDAGLSYPDYVVLVALTDHDGRLRPFELSRYLGWEKSRLSHHLSRMVDRGLVAREPCETDLRGAVVVVTPAGQAAIEAAAPGHVASVRRHFIDLLTPEQLATLADISDTVLAALEETCERHVPEDG